VHLTFTEEQEELRAAIRSVLAKECPASLPRAIVEGTGDADGLWNKMVELDWPALTVPEADGGIGYGFVELAVLVEELGRVIAPGPLFATVTQFVPFVREGGTAEQRAAVLGPVARGEATGTVAVAERPSGWDLDGIHTTLRADGDDWVLDGTKHHVLSPEVDQVAVVARLEAGDLAVAVVPTSTASVEAVDPLDKTRPVGHLTFAGVAVPDERLLRGGTAAVTRALEEATVAMALETLGTCQAIFDVTLQYAKDREQFGVPIGSFLHAARAGPGPRLLRRRLPRRGRPPPGRGHRDGQGGRRRLPALRRGRGHPAPRRDRLHLGAGPAPVGEASHDR